MKVRTGVVTMKGNVLTIQGNDIEVGDKAPDYEVLDNELSTVKLSD